MAWIDELFRKMAQVGASDLHLTSGQVPKFRLHGDIVDVQGCPALTMDHLRTVLYEITPPENRAQFDTEADTDFAYEIEGLARFRANIFLDRNGPGAVFRLIPSKILTSEDLHLPKAVLDLCYLSKGLVVVTGPTGSGKSTTLAAMVDHINKNRSDHVITIEDPIEFVHENRHRCLINQREVHKHTGSFSRALRAALREDPDIILVGEMRDLETIEIAIETAETGHLVFGTLHTTTAPSTVDRIIDQFPSERQSQIRTMLSSSLKGVVAQTLCKKMSGGRIAALEIMIASNAISSNIRDGKVFQIPSAMQMGAKFGNRLLNDSLLELVKNRVVDPTEAYVKAVNKDDLLAKFASIGVKVELPNGETPEPSTTPAPTLAAPSAPRAAQPQPRSALPSTPPSHAANSAPAPAPAAGNGYVDPFDQFKKKRP
ncbi:MAG TPA: type IV pilus twitching motility protein PilT [Planctomycetota bacterium]|nr:type IV pilus twitching motility protein PilT [Planctomycetota bacterium]